MKTALIFISSLLIITSLIISFLIVNLVENGITGASTKTNTFEEPRVYTYTKAICGNGLCQDNIITCAEETLIDITPIQGAVIKIDSDWVDPRSQEVINTYCK